MRSSITHTRRCVLGATAATMATGLIGLADPLVQHVRTWRASDARTCDTIPPARSPQVDCSPSAWPQRRSAGGRRARAIRWRDGLAQLRSADAGGTARPRRPRRLLDLHLHQLAPHAPLCPGMGREIRGCRTDRRWRAYAGVRFRAQRRQCHRSGQRDFKVDYPIALDNDYAVWGAFANHYWPAVYLADIEGQIRYHHFGEGEYAATEMVIQQLLLDAGANNSTRIWSWSTTGPGSSRRLGDAAIAGDVHRLPAEQRLRPGRRRPLRRTRCLYRAGQLPLNSWALSGNWTVTEHAAVVERARWTDRLPVPRPRLEPRHGPASKGASIPFRVFLDGQPADGAYGSRRATPMAAGRSTASAPTNSFARRGRSPTAGSRSSSMPRGGSLLLHVWIEPKHRARLR